MWDRHQTGKNPAVRFCWKQAFLGAENLVPNFVKLIQQGWGVGNFYLNWH